jgi:argininosuccinate synthase
MNASSPTGGSPVLLAFSGGLDTSFCVAWLKETLGRPVITVTVDTGGDVDTAALEARALALGAERHITVDARREFFDSVLKYLVFGNVRRGQLYPLCVGAERGLQARLVAEQAAALGSDTVAHGSTAAGNDQVRFEVALRTLRPGLEVLAPVRDHDWQRAAQVAWLEERGLPVPAGRRRLLDQSRPVGHDDRRQGDARLARVDPGKRLGRDGRRLRCAAAGGAPSARLRARHTRLAGRRAARPGDC